MKIFFGSTNYVSIEYIPNFQLKIEIICKLDPIYLAIHVNDILKVFMRRILCNVFSLKSLVTKK